MQMHAEAKTLVTMRFAGLAVIMGNN